jgi:DNA invertase Pin-like site-specific DNA recombinase
MWQMIGVLAELEGSLIKRTHPHRSEGGAARGVKFGREVKLTPEQIDHARKLITETKLASTWPTS